MTREELFKKGTDCVFNIIRGSLDGERKYTIEGIEFRSICGRNSNVQFRVKEADGWLFGLWWEEDKKNKKAVGKLFSQYERDIDKFKPSASAIVQEFWYFTDGYTCNEWCVRKLVDFIVNEPYLAYYRDCRWADLNYEYVTRSEARKLFFEQKRWYERKERLENRVNNYAIKQAKKTFKKWFDTNDAYILDDGKNSSPRYRIVLRNGSHALLETDDEKHIAWWSIEDLREYNLCKYSEWVKIEKFVDSIGKRYPGMAIWNPFSVDWCIMVANDDRFEEFKKTETIVE